MASLVKAPPTLSTINAHQVHLRKQKLLSNLNMHHGLRFPRIHVNHTTVCCTKLTPWEPSPVTYAPTIDASGNLLKKTSNIFETLKSEDTAEAPATNSEELTDTKNQSLVQFQFLHWPMWLLGPSLLLTTGLAKILKKYDKRTGGLLRLPFIQKVLEQPFFITDLVSKLVKQCEYMIDTVFPVEEEERVKEGREAITVAGEGIFRNTIAALMTMQEIRRGSSTYSHFSLPPLNLPGSDLI
uniref:Uncharacterized protein n=1 Tax=Populus trichocarpa TaxID=3694 RepID=A9PCC3_POPTR|nr:unknown [Populus trichocarpa]|eukprot:XP_006388476.2 SPX domain-containing protein 1 [Populus trichocarpa]